MDNNVEKILSYVNIVDEISGFVKLKKTGQGYTGLCPFHSEKTPSFHVSESKGLYYCFGCGKGGNIINFLIDIKRETFPEVISYLKDKYNIPLEHTRHYKNPKNSAEEKSSSEQGLLKKTLALALQYYHDNLFIYASGSAHVMDYLKNRGINETVAKDFKLGYAPFGNGLSGFLARNKARMDLAAGAGLLGAGRDPKNPYFDRYANKLIIPIFNVNGEVIAFSARGLEGSSGPKYVNTNNSKIFIKNETLYGLDKSSPFIKSMNSAIVVEGYFDMITLYSTGIKNVAATMGTTLSRSHIMALSRLCDNIILLYDGDRAGINAINRGIDLFAGFMENPDKNIYAATLNGNDDPDGFVRTYGSEALARLISENRKNPVEFLLNYHLDNILLKKGTESPGETSGFIENPSNYDIMNNRSQEEDLKKKVLVIKEIAPFLKKMENEIILSYYLNLISGKLGLKEDAVRKFLFSKQPGIVNTRQSAIAGFSGFPANCCDDSIVEDLIIEKVFSNFLLTDYVNDDTITEFSNKDAVFIIREIKGLVKGLGEAEKRNNPRFESHFIDGIISKTDKAEKWRNIYYSSAILNDSSKSVIDFKKLLIRLKIKNIDGKCLRLLRESKDPLSDSPTRLSKLKEIADLKFVSQECKKKMQLLT